MTRLVFTPKSDLGVYEFEGLTALSVLFEGVIPRDYAVPQVWHALQDSFMFPASASEPGLD